MTPEELLRKYNPVLVILPEDSARHRPWSRWYEKVTVPRGDYHPCSVKFFLSHVVQRDRPNPWHPLKFTEPAQPDPTGYDNLEIATTKTDPEATRGWELDLAPISSQKAGQAWTAYGLMREKSPDRGSFAYGRYVGGPRPVLEYWYLYAYNDAPNRHEGDWEMVAVEVDEQGGAVRAGYAGHASGFRREWPRVETRDGRPVVYVARGSHAAYFHHDPDGHRANSLHPRKGWMEPFETLWGIFNRKVQDFFEFLRLVDHTAPNPEQAPGSPHAGIFLEPELVPLPEIDDVPRQPEFWWMNLRGLWGSRHARLQGTIGPSPPWEQKGKWQEPAKWLDSIVQD